MTDRFNLNLNDEVGRLVREEAARSGTTMTEVISKMIRFYAETKLLRDPDVEVVVTNTVTGRSTLVVLVSH